MSGFEGFIAGVVATAELEKRKVQRELSQAELDKLIEDLIKRHELALKMLADH